MKIVSLGGGVTRTRELARSLLDRPGRIRVRGLWIEDPDPARLRETVASVSRVVARGGACFPVHASRGLDAALDGADFVIFRLSVGGLEARREDVALCRRWGLPEHEATGAAAVSCGLRTVPALLALAGRMAERCPGAWLINTTNPVGLLVEALHQAFPGVLSAGISGEAYRVRAWAAEASEAAGPADVDLDYLGLDHLAWVRGARAGGQDLWRRTVSEDGSGVSRGVTVRLGMVWDHYVRSGSRYGAAHPPATSSGGRESAEDAPGPARGPDPLNVRPLAGSDARWGSQGWLSAALAGFMETASADAGGVEIVHARQQGAAEWLPAEWVLELPCKVFRKRLEPLPVEPLPVAGRALLEVVKNAELLAVEAALSGRRSTALAALLAHPLGPGPDQAEAVLEDLLETHRRHLPLFRGSRPPVTG